MPKFDQTDKNSNNDFSDSYKANRAQQQENNQPNPKKQQKAKNEDTNKKTAKVAAKAAANYFTGGKGGAVVDKLADTKLGNAALNKMGNSFMKRNPGLQKVANKMNDSGALDAADKGMDLGAGGKFGGGSGANTPGNTSSQSSQSGSSFGKSLNQIGGGKKNNPFQNPFSKSQEEESDGELDTSKGSSDFSSLIKGFILKNPMVGLTTIIIIATFGILFLAFITCVMSSASDGSGESGEPNSEESGESSDTGVCSVISMNSTALTKTQFAEKLQAKANSSGSIGYKTFAANADKIYDISVKNNINPEMVVIRAAVEGFSPGAAKNNYWGMGCTNSGGYAACISYSSFSDGVLGYVKNISQYESVEAMMSRYAYIGANWYSPGSSSAGGCYYYPYIKKYMSSARSESVKNACSKSCSGSSCMKTNAEDQKAYSSYQAETMVSMRSNIFGIGEDKCESSDSDTSGGNIGQKAVDYAVKTFDSFSYSQSNRYGSSSVDCSSLVSRTYKHFNINISSNGSDTASEEYRWCVTKGKTIKEKDLKPGDLIFFAGGSYYTPSRYKGIGHVAIYIGNNKQFAAHTPRVAQPDQVSVSSYTKGIGTYFCRPYK